MYLSQLLRVIAFRFAGVRGGQRNDQEIPELDVLPCLFPDELPEHIRIDGVEQRIDPLLDGFALRRFFSALAFGGLLFFFQTKHILLQIKKYCRDMFAYWPHIVRATAQMFDDLAVIDNQANGVWFRALDDRFILSRSTLFRLMHLTVPKIGQAALQDYVIDTLVEPVQGNPHGSFNGLMIYSCMTGMRRRTRAKITSDRWRNTLYCNNSHC